MFYYVIFLMERKIFFFGDKWDPKVISHNIMNSYYKILELISQGLKPSNKTKYTCLIEFLNLSKNFNGYRSSRLCMTKTIMSNPILNLPNNRETLLKYLCPI